MNILQEMVREVVNHNRELFIGANGTMRLLNENDSVRNDREKLKEALGSDYRRLEFILQPLRRDSSSSPESKSSEYVNAVIVCDEFGNPGSRLPNRIISELRREVFASQDAPRLQGSMKSRKCHFVPSRGGRRLLEGGGKQLKLEKKLNEY